MRKLKTLIIGTFLCLIGAQATYAACITDGDAKGVLRFYELPDNTSAIRGGVKVGQCDVVVTGKCEGPWCFARHGSLFGWVDTQYLDEKPQPAAASSRNSPSSSNGNNNPLGGTLVYRVTGGGGVFDMLGNKQNLPVDPGGEVSFVPQGGNVYEMIISPITSDRITLTPANGTWNGVMNDWAGQPMNIKVTGFKIGMPSASIKMNGKAPFGTMEMVLQLGLKSSGNSSSGTTPLPSNNNQNSNSPSDDSPCGRLDKIEAKASEAGNSFMLRKIARIKKDAGFTPGGRVTLGGCRKVLALLEQDGIVADLVGLFGPEASWTNGGAKSAQNSNSNQSGSNNPQIYGRNNPCEILEKIQTRVNNSGDSQLQALVQTIRNKTKTVRGTSYTIPDCYKANEELAKGGVLATLEQQFGPLDSWPNARQLADNQNKNDNTGRAGNLIPTDNGNACSALRIEFSTILRGGNEERKILLRSLLKVAGILDIGRATNQQCSDVLVGISVGSASAGNTLTPKPYSGPGEDPNTMIEGGKEIPGSPSDFEPTSNNQAAAISPSNPANGTSEAANGSNFCYRANAAVISVVARGSVLEMKFASQLLNQYQNADILNADERDCREIFLTMQSEGLVR